MRREDVVRETLFDVLRLVCDEIQRGRDPSSLVRRAEGMIDVLADVGIITDATAERCADWLERRMYEVQHGK